MKTAAMRVLLVLAAFATVYAGKTDICEDIPTKCEDCAENSGCIIGYFNNFMEAMCPVIEEAMGDMMAQFGEMAVAGAEADNARRRLGHRALQGLGLEGLPGMLPGMNMQCIEDIMNDMMGGMMGGGRRLEAEGGEDDGDMETDMGDMDGMMDAIMGPIKNMMKAIGEMDVAKPAACDQALFDSMDGMRKMLKDMDLDAIMGAAMSGQEIEDPTKDAMAEMEAAMGDCDPNNIESCGRYFLCSNPDAISQVLRIPKAKREKIIKKGGKFAKIFNDDGEIDTEGLSALSDEEIAELKDEDLITDEQMEDIQKFQQVEGGDESPASVVKATFAAALALFML